MTEQSPVSSAADPDAGQGSRSLAEQVADAVLAVPGVTGLHGGLFGEVATYLPGGRVSGVALSDDHGEVHLVVGLDQDLRSVAEDARDAAERLTGSPVSVTIEDISTGGNDSADAGDDEPEERNHE
ncbi:hypothetical protein AAFP35_11255 [Gordonia sp. CPCC 206044]|uniref:hypothetical protein n=1 Tax=Gordonia sp. CPCC 206044 TaxID=3140793 RepID=UPI003AF36E8D